MKYIQLKDKCTGRQKTALVLDGMKWINLNEKVLEGQREKESLERATEQQNSRANKCKNLTEKWPNTLISVQKERERTRMQAANELKKQRLKEYNDIMEAREKERQRIVENAKKLIFERSEPHRMIASGLIMSGILQEREIQINLLREERVRLCQNKLKEIAIRKEKEKRTAEEEVLEKKKHAENMARVRAAIDEQMKDILQRKKQDDEEKNREKQDLENLRRELQETQEKEARNILDAKRKLKEEQESFAALTEKHRAQRRKAEKELEEMNSIYQAVRDKLDEQRLLKEKQLKEDIIKRRAKVPLSMRPQKVDHTAEDNSIKKISEEKTKQQEKEYKERLQKKERLRQEVLLFQKETAKRALQKMYEEKELRRAEILQRLALEEKSNIWREAEAEKKRQQQRELCDTLLQQWQEREEKEIKDNCDESIAREQALSEEKTTLMKYCEEVERKARDTGKPLYPVLKAIEKVKKTAGLLDREKKIPFLQSKVPIQSTSHDKKTNL